MEDHLHFAGESRALTAGDVRDVGAVEADVAIGDRCEPENGPTDCRLAGARLADKPQGTTLGDLE